ncbi:MAG: protein-glutamate methylesterase/protein-glutamine glutaminase [Solirubrobacterales bacterium]
MNKNRRIRLLVVDDSMVFRESLRTGLSADPSLEVVATAVDAYHARDQIIEFEPDVMVLDVELPKMNGIEFLRRLMPQYPIPVVVMSGLGDYVFEALTYGAVDFVAKPGLGNKRSLDSFMNELIVKIKIASTAKVGHWKHRPSAARALPDRTSYDKADRLIAIGASTGGTEALATILKAVPNHTPPILLVQHMPAGFTRMFAERLNHECLIEIKEAEDGDRVIPGRALLAPGEYHMRLKKSGSGLVVSCLPGEKVSGHCPSVDVLFQSVAQLAGRTAIGVLLTGMGRDGAQGLLDMRRSGARTLGQDEESSLIYGMPKVAWDLGAVERQTSIENMAQAIFSLVETKSAG